MPDQDETTCICELCGGEGFIARFRDVWVRGGHSTEDWNDPCDCEAGAAYAEAVAAAQEERALTRSGL